jgi:hypothetical protein
LKYLEEIIIRKKQIDLYFKIISYKNLKVKNIKFQDSTESAFLFDNRDRIIETKSLKQCAIIVRQHSSYLNKDEINKINKIFLDTKDKDIIFDYIINSLQLVFPEAEKYILQNSRYATEYAIHIMKKRWEEAEDIILKNKDDMQSIYSYYVKFLYKKEKEGENFSNIEDLIADSPNFAYMFAKNQIKGRWEKGEKAILTNPSILYSYISDVIKKRIPEFEEAILKHENSSICYKYYDYLRRYLRSDWKEGIPIIIKHPRYAMLLSTDLRSRIPEAEKIIASNSETAYIYADKRFHKPKTFDRIRWIDMKDIDSKVAEEAEKNIFNDSHFASKYIINFIGHRIKVLEDLISKDAEGAYIYAYRFFKEKNKNSFFDYKRWIDMEDIDPEISIQAENSILTNIEVALDYCEDIIQDRWEELEYEIIDKPEWAIRYAYNIIRGPWFDAGIYADDLREYYREVIAPQDED